MRGPAVDSDRGQHTTFAILVTVALISAALIAYEIVLMRRLLIESWHHFGYLVISTALLGFGASGTFLAVIERRVRARPRETMFWLTVGMAAALLVMPRLASRLPVTARFIPDDLWDQVGWWSLYWLTALIPFLLGAAFLILPDRRWALAVVHPDDRGPVGPGVSCPPGRKLRSTGSARDSHAGVVRTGGGSRELVAVAAIL